MDDFVLVEVFDPGTVPRQPTEGDPIEHTGLHDITYVWMDRYNNGETIISNG